MRAPRPIRCTGVAATAAALLVAGCGGAERQDADEPEGSFQVDVEQVDFPPEQSLAEQSTFEIVVRNAGSEAVPNLAVTLEGFATGPDVSAGGADEGTVAGDGDAARRTRADAESDPTQPVWIVDSEPRGGVTAYDDTWTAGRLAPGATRTLRWQVTPVVPGTHSVEYRVAAGLDGKAKAVGAGGQATMGTFRVTVDDEPPAARVDPRTGEVERVPPPEG